MDDPDTREFTARERLLLECMLHGVPPFMARDAIASIEIDRGPGAQVTHSPESTTEESTDD